MALRGVCDPSQSQVRRLVRLTILPFLSFSKCYYFYEQKYEKKFLRRRSYISHPVSINYREKVSWSK